MATTPGLIFSVGENRAGKHQQRKSPKRLRQMGVAEEHTYNSTF